VRDREPTIRSRALGEGLGRAMRQAGLNGKQVGHQLGWSSSRVSRLLSGKRGGSEVDVSAFLAVCGVKGTERDRLLELCREQNASGWLEQYSRLPQHLVTYIDHEDKATKIAWFQVVLVPGLLQTGDYAREVMSCINIPANEIHDRVAARLARQSLFSKPRPPSCTFYLHELVLRLPVGGPAVMSDQLHHLLRMAVRPSVTLRVLPTSRGAHAAWSGSFVFMEFAEFRPLVYLESATSCLFLEKPEETEVYKDILMTLADTALSEEESKKLIANIATELNPDGDDYGRPR
jgi:transcriptional regulator with XRE-family HTH domain